MPRFANLAARAGGKALAAAGLACTGAAAGSAGLLSEAAACSKDHKLTGGLKRYHSSANQAGTCRSDFLQAWQVVLRNGSERFHKTEQL